MATVVENINQAKSDLLGCKAAIIAKGVEIPSGTPTSEYSEKIREIQTGITPSGSIFIDVNGTQDVTDYAEVEVVVPTYESDIITLIERHATNFDIPFGVGNIGSYAFYNWTGLGGVVVPNTVRIIGDYAFYGCTGLTDITLPGELTAIGAHAFDGCTSLAHINFDGTRADWDNVTIGTDAIPQGVTIYCNDD